MLRYGSAHSQRLDLERPKTPRRPATSCGCAARATATRSSWASRRRRTRRARSRGWATRRIRSGRAGQPKPARAISTPTPRSSRTRAPAKRRLLAHARQPAEHGLPRDAAHQTAATSCRRATRSSSRRPTARRPPSSTPTRASTCGRRAATAGRRRRPLYGDRAAGLLQLLGLNNSKGWLIGWEPPPIPSPAPGTRSPAARRLGAAPEHLRPAEPDLHRRLAPGALCLHGRPLDAERRVVRDVVWSRSSSTRRTSRVRVVWHELAAGQCDVAV